MSTAPSRASPPPSPSTSSLPRRPSATPSRNPISLRLHKVLGYSFDDPSSREALETVSAFYSSEAVASNEGVGKEGGVTGDGRISEIGEGAAEKARRGLRRDGEERLAEGSKRFLQAFGEVDKKLEILQRHMQEMHTRCDDVQARLTSANSGTQFLLERAEGLRAQEASTQLRSTLIDLFLSRFTLAQSELETLTSRDVPVGMPLFAAMDRVVEIRRDCRSLLGGEEGGTTAGLDIMRATGQQLEAGYQKIFRWCTFEFRQFVREAQLEVGVVMKEAVKRLRERKPLLNEALQTLSTLRQSSLLTLFLDALTRGTSSTNPNPIELHAHDPQRYVGDMLAWIHQATAGEREFLESLFGVGEDGRMVGSTRRFKGSVKGRVGRDGEEELDGRFGGRKGKGRGLLSDEEEKEELVREMMDRDLEGCCRPLRIRIQTTIKSQDGVLESYRIVNLLQFYLVTMKRTIGEDALLTKTLQDIHDVSYKSFFDTLDAKGRSLLRFLHPPDSDLSPPIALRDASLILRELLSVHESALIDVALPPSRSSPLPNDERPAVGEREELETEFGRILDAAIDPLLEMCRRMADLRGEKGGAWERAVFLANCVGYLEHVLESFDFTKERVALLQDQMDRHIKLLTNEHFDTCLHQSGLEPIYKTLSEKEPGTPLSRLPDTSPSSLTTSLKSFDAYLTHLDVLSSPSLALLSSPTLHRSIHRSALGRLAGVYDEIWKAVMDKEEGRYEFPESMLIRGREEVRVLLGVDGDE